MDKPPLVSQASAAPTRKLWAVIIAGIVMSVARSLLVTYLPDLPADDILFQVAPYVQVGVMAIAGYLTRNRAVES